MNSILSKLTIFNILLISLFVNTIETVSANETASGSDSTQISQEISSPQDSLSSTETSSGGVIEKTPLSEEDNLENIEVDLKKETFFVVTAYYSPLPDQKYYLKGNYDDEVRLNGRGVRGASGKEVFPGMLAAPKTYSFGTRVYLEGVGVGEVADRGGAIVSASGSDSRGYQYDRIDIWMGFGDEGLKRALTFGKKIVPGYIVTDNSKSVGIELSRFPSPDSAVKGLEKREKIAVPSDIDVFNTRISPDSTDSENIKKLQKLMYKIGASKSLQTSGLYADVKNDLISYQLLHNIIARREDEEAGYFGPRTSKQMKEDYLEDIDDKKIEEKIQKIQVKAMTNAKTIMSRIGSPKFGQKNNNVKLLQQALVLLKVTSTKPSGTFGDKTEFALIKYQLSKGIINSKESEGAGVFGPKTKAQLEKDLIIIIEKQLFQSENLMSYYNKRS